MTDTQWHIMTKEDALGALSSDPVNGLSPEEAHARLIRYGPNELLGKGRKHPLLMLLDQFKDFMIIVLIAAAVVSGFIGEASDTVAIIVIVLLNAVIGFAQEYRAEKAISALKKMAVPWATVIRDGKPSDIPAIDIAPGDIVLLEAGKVVPADLRIIEAAQLRVEEAALTGESVPVEKNAKPLKDRHLPLGDRKNMAYKGTFVTYGRGAGVAVATGMDTELGKIASMLQEEKQVRTPLQRRLAVFGQKIALAVIAISAVVFAAGVLRGEDTLLMLLTAISLAVAAIPEALPAVVTVSLALGAKKMVRQKALIRSLPAVETLGSVTYICSDKTGTLTLNKMSVEEFFTDGRTLSRAEIAPGSIEDAKGLKDPLAILLAAIGLSNDTKLDPSGKPLGDPTEVALFEIASEKDFHKARLEEVFPRIAEIPFDSERKMMTTFHKWPDQTPLTNNGKFVSFTKGAIEALTERAEMVLTSGGLRGKDPLKINSANEKMSSEGLRVLGIAMRLWDELPQDVSSENVETGLTLLGLVGMVDPPREEAKEAVSLCKTAGIKPVMITGDHPLTARAIAARLGIFGGDARGIITGRELESLPMEEFEERVEHIRVYARVAPEQKLKIIKGLQDRGQFVAMTGDGVNDAPALKRANIGIAMGVTGTDVAKEAAHMILLDDNFSTIVRAVKEGRRIFDNIRKFIRYTMTSNSGEIWTIFLAPFLGLPVPLLPIHILWINLVTDGLPGLALAMEPAEKEIMRKPPRPPEESIFAHGLGMHIIWVGFLMGAVSIFTQAVSIRLDYHWQTMVFTVLCLNQMGHVLAIRSERESLLTTGLLSNKPLLGAVLLTFFLQMATVYVPFLNPIFRTEPLTSEELVVTLALSMVVFIAVEIEKFVWRRVRPEGL
jgi:Ca2+-transporting ATPase